MEDTSVLGTSASEASTTDASALTSSSDSDVEEDRITLWNILSVRMIHDFLINSFTKPVCLVVGAVFAGYFIAFVGLSVAWCIPLMYCVASTINVIVSRLVRKGIVKDREARRKKDDCPQLESCEWLNRILDAVYCNHHKYISHLFVRFTEPLMMKLCTPHPVEAVRFQSLDVGKIGPKLSDLTVTRISEDELSYDFTVDYQSDFHGVVISKLAHSPVIPVYITDLVFQGRMRFTVKFVQDRYPFISSLKWHLLSRPKIDISVKAGGLPDLLEMPSVTDYFLNLVIDQMVEEIHYPKYVEADFTGAVPSPDTGLETDEKKFVDGIAALIPEIIAHGEAARAAEEPTDKLDSRFPVLGMASKAKHALFGKWGKKTPVVPRKNEPASAPRASAQTQAPSRTVSADVPAKMLDPSSAAASKGSRGGGSMIAGMASARSGGSKLSPIPSSKSGGSTIAGVASTKSGGSKIGPTATPGAQINITASDGTSQEVGDGPRTPKGGRVRSRSKSYNQYELPKPLFKPPVLEASASAEVPLPDKPEPFAKRRSLSWDGQDGPMISVMAQQSIEEQMLPSKYAKKKGLLRRVRDSVRHSFTPVHQKSMEEPLSMEQLTSLTVSSSVSAKTTTRDALEQMKQEGRHRTSSQALPPADRVITNRLSQTWGSDLGQHVKAAGLTRSLNEESKKDSAPGSFDWGKLAGPEKADESVPETDAARKKSHRRSRSDVHVTPGTLRELEQHDERPKSILAPPHTTSQFPQLPVIGGTPKPPRRRTSKKKIRRSISVDDELSKFGAGKNKKTLKQKRETESEHVPLPASYSLPDNTADTITDTSSFVDDFEQDLMTDSSFDEFVGGEEKVVKKPRSSSKERDGKSSGKEREKKKRKRKRSSSKDKGGVEPHGPARTDSVDALKSTARTDSSDTLSVKIDMRGTGLSDEDLLGTVVGAVGQVKFQ